MSEMIWPLDPQDADLPVKWALQATHQVLRWVWTGYDQLRSKVGSINFALPMKQLERDLVERHFNEILAVWRQDTQGGFTSLHPGHEISEFLSCSAPPAKPPAYDLCFTHFNEQLWKWPIEAKLLKTPRSLSEYLKDVNNKFVGGIAAPIIGEGAMIGYLLKGAAESVFAALSKHLTQSLIPIAWFSTYDHRCTHHQRVAKPALRLHHLIMNLP